MSETRRFFCDVEVDGVTDVAELVLAVVLAAPKVGLVEIDQAQVLSAWCQVPPAHTTWWDWGFGGVWGGFGGVWGGFGGLGGVWGGLGGFGGVWGGLEVLGVLGVLRGFWGSLVDFFVFFWVFFGGFWGVFGGFFGSFLVGFLGVLLS